MANRSTTVCEQIHHTSKRSICTPVVYLVFFCEFPASSHACFHVSDNLGFSGLHATKITPINLNILITFDLLRGSGRNRTFIFRLVPDILMQHEWTSSRTRQYEYALGKRRVGNAASLNPNVWLPMPTIRPLYQLELRRQT